MWAYGQGGKHLPAPASFNSQDAVPSEVRLPKWFPSSDALQETPHVSQWVIRVSTVPQGYTLPVWVVGMQKCISRTSCGCGGYCALSAPTPNQRPTMRFAG